MKPPYNNAGKAWKPRLFLFYWLSFAQTHSLEGICKAGQIPHALSKIWSQNCCILASERFFHPDTVEVTPVGLAVHKLAQNMGNKLLADVDFEK